MFNTDTAREMFERIGTYVPVTYDNAGFCMKWEAFAITAFLLAVGYYALWHKGKADRAELVARRKLDCGRRRLDFAIEALYTNTLADTLVKGRIKARHLKRLAQAKANGGSKEPEPKNSLEVLLRS